jgi:hypothetical protein
VAREIVTEHRLARPDLSPGAGGGTLQLLRDIGSIGDG